MRSKDPNHEVEMLLRSQKPQPKPAPGLEARILRALDRQERPRKPLVWPWFLLPPAIAMAMVLMWPHVSAPSTAPPVVTIAPPPPPIPLTMPDSGLLALNGVNPLETEARALSRDARRAGRFLIDCMPSISLSNR